MPYSARAHLVPSSHITSLNLPQLPIPLMVLSANDKNSNCGVSSKLNAFGISPPSRLERETFKERREEGSEDAGGGAEKSLKLNKLIPLKV